MDATDSNSCPAFASAVKAAIRASDKVPLLRLHFREKEALSIGDAGWESGAAAAAP